MSQALQQKGAFHMTRFSCHGTENSHMQLSRDRNQIQLRLVMLASPFHPLSVAIPSDTMQQSHWQATHKLWEACTTASFLKQLPPIIGLGNSMACAFFLWPEGGAFLCSPHWGPQVSIQWGQLPSFAYRSIWVPLHQIFSTYLYLTAASKKSIHSYLLIMAGPSCPQSPTHLQHCISYFLDAPIQNGWYSLVFQNTLTSARNRASLKRVGLLVFVVPKVSTIVTTSVLWCRSHRLLKPN